MPVAKCSRLACPRVRRGSFRSRSPDALRTVATHAARIQLTPARTTCSAHAPVHVASTKLNRKRSKRGHTCIVVRTDRLISRYGSNNYERTLLFEIRSRRRRRRRRFVERLSTTHATSTGLCEQLGVIDAPSGEMTLHRVLFYFLSSVMVTMLFGPDPIVNRISKPVVEFVIESDTYVIVLSIWKILYFM